jgi:hypothetical protein
MMYKWQRVLGKIPDIVFTIPVGCDLWEAYQFEPVIIGVCLPLLSSSPWQIKHCVDKVHACEHALGNKKDICKGKDTVQGMWSTDCAIERHGLRKLWLYAKKRTSL